MKPHACTIAKATTPILIAFLTMAVFAHPAAAQKSSPAAIELYRAAVALQNQQLYDLAAEEWQAFTKKHANDQYIGNAQHYLGVCYFQDDKFAKADKAFDAALAANARVNPKGKVAISTTLLNQGLARFNLALAIEAKDKNAATAAFQATATTLNRLKSEFPNSKEVKEGNYYLAESLYATNQKENAIRLYEQTVNSSPQHPQREKLLYGLGVAYQESNNVDAARRTFEKLKQEFPKSEFGDEIATRRGDTLFAAKKFAQAASAYASVAGNSNSKFADYSLLQQAACEFKQKKYADAGRLYASVVQRFPKSEYVGSATLSAGKCLHLGGDPNAAQWLAKAAKLKGVESLEATHWLARVQLKNNKAADAIAPLEQAIKAAAGNPKGKTILPQLRLDLADAYYEIKDRRTAAAKLYEQIASQHADHEAAPQARYMAAFAAMERNDHAAARQHAKQFLGKWSKDDLRADVMAIDAESQLQLGEHEAAGRKFEALVNNFAKRPERESWISRRAICLNRDNKHDEVINWLNSRMNDIKSAEVRGESQFLLGSAYLNKGDTDKAVQLLNGSLQTAPKGLQADRALLLLSEAQQQSKQVEPALASVRRLLKDYPQSKVVTQARFREAELLYAAGDFKNAATSYQAVIKTAAQNQNVEQDPNQGSKQDRKNDLQPSALFGLAWSQLSLEDYDSASKTLDALTRKHGDHELARKARYAMGVAYQQRQEYDKALNALNQYLQQGDLEKADKADALYLRGLCRVGKGEHEQAAKDFQSVTQTSPDYADGEQVLYEMAWAFQDGKKVDQAAAAFRQLAKKHPQGEFAAESWYRVAEHDYGKKKYAEAAQSYTQSMQRAKNQPEIASRAAHKLGWANYQLKKYPEAEQAFKKQLTTAKGTKAENDDLAATAKLMAGECAYQQKQYDRAHAVFQKSLATADRVNPALRALSLLHAGQSAAQLDQWQASAKSLQRCVEEFPDSRSIHQARYELGFALQNMEQVDKAKQLYEQVSTDTNTPVGARARFMLGELQFAEGDHNTAIRTFAKVFSGYGGDQAPKEYHQWQADSLFEAARCCESTKRTDSAKRFYTQLMKSYPNSDKVNAARTKLQNLGQ